MIQKSDAGTPGRSQIRQDDEDDDEDDVQSPTTTQRGNRNNRGKRTPGYVLTQPILSGFGKDVMKHFRILPKPKFLLGSLEKEPILKNKVVRQKRQVDRSVEVLKTKIKEVDPNSKDVDDNNTVSMTEKIFKI